MARRSARYICRGLGGSGSGWAALAAKDCRRYHEYLRPKTPGGRGFVVSQAQFDAGTRRGNAIMIGSTEQLIGRPRHAGHHREPARAGGHHNPAEKP